MRIISLVLVMGTLFSFDVFSKRLGPKKVKPLEFKGIRYEVIHFVDNEKQNGGFIRVVDIKSQDKICIKKVYEVNYDKNLEQDVQDIFITKIKRVKDKLIIKNENGQKYKIKLKEICMNEG